jgi:pimeloyl-ACP methyl ester carboxylesterase
MKQFYLPEIKTKDGLLHQGIFSQPSRKASAGKPHSNRAILWVHGLSAAFYNDINLYEEVAGACEKEGWGFAVFNNRGHDLIAGIRKYDGTPPNGYSYLAAGAGQEVFEDSAMDIDAGIDFLVQKGFTEIILVGHSTGANKVCYYAAVKKNPHVAGVVLSGPMSDRLDPLISQEKRKKDLTLMHSLIRKGKGDELLLGYHFFPMTPKRYVSLFEPGTTEDTFDYGDRDPKMTYFSKITLPLLVVLAGKDEYTDRPVEVIKKVFDSRVISKNYTSVIIPGAPHKFNGYERDFADIIVNFLIRL